MRKFKYILIIFIFLFSIILSVLFYYHLDPALLTKLSFYIDLANPNIRIVRVQEGMRKEEVAFVVAEKLNWNEQNKEDFINMHIAFNTSDMEGRYFPKTYLIDKDEMPYKVGSIMVDEFSKQMEKMENSKAKQIINEDTVVKIASIIQREAGGKSDMALISGIIWNRIWNGMKLQMDATLQYAKGNEEEGWWRKVDIKDKKIDSPYNTYLYEGLPPGPIANPGIDAIYAAYHPAKTDCIFYLHDKNRKIYCSKTYEEHKKNIEKYY